MVGDINCVHNTVLALRVGPAPYRCVMTTERVQNGKGDGHVRRGSKAWHGGGGNGGEEGGKDVGKDKGQRAPSGLGGLGSKLRADQRLHGAP
jgi:hypothetical protein